MLSLQDSTTDQCKISDIYKNWPVYFRAAQDICYSLRNPPSHYKSIILAGMGQFVSSVCVKAMLDKCGAVPSGCLRGEPMPSYIDERSLVIISSVSGNTKESLGVLKKAFERKSEVICTRCRRLEHRIPFSTRSISR